MAARRSSFRRAAPRRKTGWGAGFQSDLVSVSAVGKALIEGFTYVDGILDEGATLARIRGNVQVLHDGGGPQEGWLYAMGIGILPAVSVAAGAAALPGPFTDADWEGWIWHYAGVIHTADAALLSNDGPPDFMEKIDSKAMRKFDSNEEAFFFMWEADTETGTMTSRIRVHTRHLYLLP